MSDSPIRSQAAQIVRRVFDEWQDKDGMAALEDRLAEAIADALAARDPQQEPCYCCRESGCQDGCRCKPIDDEADPPARLPEAQR